VPIAERFWPKVDKSGDCWRWLAGTNPYGYGMFNVSPRQPRRAHRVAWELVNGPLPPGKVLRHKCDNPPCVNPDHLEVGTKAENSQDMADRHRSTFYERNPLAKLTFAQVCEIRSLYSRGALQRELAIKFGVSRPNISRIVNLKGWVGHDDAPRTSGVTAGREV
jgi:hypothetical protein